MEFDPKYSEKLGKFFIHSYRVNYFFNTYLPQELKRFVRSERYSKEKYEEYSNKLIKESQANLDYFREKMGRSMIIVSLRKLRRIWREADVVSYAEFTNMSQSSESKELLDFLDSFSYDAIDYECFIEKRIR